MRPKMRLDPFGTSGQAMTEYLLVFALIAIAVAASIAAWNLPIARYLDHIAQILAKTR